MDGPPQAGLLCGDSKPRHLLGAEAPGYPMRTPSGPWVCSQGDLMGWAPAASKGTQNVPSQYSESIWAGCLSAWPPEDGACAVWKA